MYARPDNEGFDSAGFIQRLGMRLGCRLAGCLFSLFVGLLAVPCVMGLAYIANEASSPSRSTKALTVEEKIARTRPYTSTFIPPVKDIEVDLKIPKQFKGLDFDIQSSHQAHGFYKFSAAITNNTGKTITEIKAEIEVLDKKGRAFAKEPETLRNDFMAPPVQPGDLALVSALVTVSKNKPKVASARLRITAVAFSGDEAGSTKGKKIKLRWLIEPPQGVKLKARVRGEIKKQSAGKTADKVDFALFVELTNTGSVPIANLSLQSRLLSTGGEVVGVGSGLAFPPNTVLYPGQAVTAAVRSFQQTDFDRHKLYVVGLNTPR